MEQFHKALDHELCGLDRGSCKGLRGLLDDLWASRLLEDPFPKDATERLRDYARDVTKRFAIKLLAGKRLQQQPVGVLLLGSVLRALSDPDW